MKNKNFTTNLNMIVSRAYVVFMFLFAFSMMQNVNAQCPLSSNDLVQVSVINDCSATVTPEMIIEGEDDNGNCGYEIFTIVDENGVEVGHAEAGNTGNWVLDGNAYYYGQILMASVRYVADDGNSTMGGLYLEDKMAPTLRCLEDVRVSCSEDLSNYLTTNPNVPYEVASPTEVENTVGPNYHNFPIDPIVIAAGEDARIPFEVDNQANQSEIIEYVQALLSISSTSQVTVRIESPTENSTNTGTGRDYFFAGKQAVDPYVNGTWYIVVENNSGSTRTVTSARLKIKSTSFLTIGNGVIADDNCHQDDIVIDILADFTEPNDTACGTYFQQRTIRYQATDWRGMKSPICEHKIKWDRKGFDDMEWPHNWDGLDNPPLSCSGKFMKEDNNGNFSEASNSWDANGDGYPQPGEVDVPLIDGNPIYPDPHYCMLNVTYTDEIIDICPGSFKVLRKWLAYDMCMAGGDDCCNGDANPRTHYQIIKVIDNTPITFETNSTSYIEVSANPFDCSACVVLPVPIIQNYGCSDGYTYEVGYCATGDGIYVDDKITSRVVNGETIYTICELPVGETCVRYIVTDLCGNQSKGTLTVHVIDDIPPIPVCDEHTVATVTTDCTARINAETFDDGSFDNCSEVSFEVAKMYGSGSVGTFGPYVDYGSGDVGKTSQVVLKVIDDNGNWNTCMVEVYIDDKIPPSITCPKDVTIACGDDPYDVSSTGGQPTYWDNCSPVLSGPEYTGSLNNCGVGTLTRRWTVSDGVRSRSCTQRIKVVNDSPFTMHTYNWPRDRNNLIGCNDADTSPDNTGKPDISGDDLCSMVAFTHTDRVFDVVQGACFKILRDWTVIDWCQYNDNNPVYLGQLGHPYVGMWTHTQVIMVNDYNAPVFTSSCSNISVCAYNSDCTGDVNLIAEADDECTPDSELAWSYEVRDVGNVLVRRGNTNAFNKSHMQLGIYYIHWTVEDKCGNASECEYRFEVEDCKNPTPLCYSEITTVVMPSTDPRMVTVNARDFDRGSTDNCNPGATCGDCNTDLRFSFSGTNPYDSERTFDETQVGIQYLDMWVWDLAGNRDFCTVTLHVQDNVSGLSPIIAGSIVTEDEKVIDGAEVEVEDMNLHETQGATTNNNGFFQIEVEGNSSYKVEADMADNYLNGLTTLDLVIIQKHILGISDLDSPYKIIAADANLDKRVTASDILILRKLILGQNDKLEGTSAWAFVDEGFEYVNPENPWTENHGEMYSITLNNLTENNLNNKFIGLKIGDVNNSVEIGQSEVVEPRSVMSFNIDNQTFDAGETVSVPVYASNFEDIAGMQMSMNFNSDLMEVKSIEGAAIKVNSSNYLVKDNELNISWSSMKGYTFNEDEILFTIEFAAKTAGQLMNQIDVTNKISPEAYNNNLDVFGIELNFRNTGNGEFVLYQNTPNPFSNDTEIAFEIPESGMVTITVYDITGKVMVQKSGEFENGYNSVKVSKDDLKGASGVLYYKVENDSYTAIKKMIVISK